MQSLKHLLLLMLLTMLAVVSCGADLLHSDSQSTKSEARSPQIVLNQVGYRPGWTKVALLVNGKELTSENIEVVDASSQKSVFSIKPGTASRDRSSGERVQQLNFSEFQKEGQYYLRSGKLKSHSFAIGQTAYRTPLITLLRSYYLQRCGVALQDAVTTIHHPPCHLRDGLVAHKDSFHQVGDAISAQGGWHDAGDYGKYVATTAVTVGQLLTLYEQYPQLFRDRQLSIPESGNGIPDLLDEMKIGLDWMLAMQRQDGAVYRKLSGKKWSPVTPPDQDNQPRYVYGISTPETAKFTAAMAIAARVYASQQPEQAAIYLSSAKKAWNFLQAEPAMKVDWVAGDDDGSGKYLLSEVDQEESLKTDRDDRLWAAAELFVTTGEPVFEQYFAQTLPALSYTLFEWKDPSALGMANYLFQKPSQGNKSLKEQIATKLLQRANQLVKTTAKNDYSLANQQFIWGSNKMAAEEGITLMYAYRLTHQSMYLKAAIAQLDYLLGRNPFNQTFVTGIGTQPVKHVHHLFARAQKIVIPGLFVGGPNSGAQDGIAPKGQALLSYIDDERSYATNEYAIDYNAALIGLIGMLIGE